MDLSGQQKIRFFPCSPAFLLSRHVELSSIFHTSTSTTHFASIRARRRSCFSFVRSTRDPRESFLRYQEKAKTGVCVPLFDFSQSKCGRSWFRCALFTFILRFCYKWVCLEREENFGFYFAGGETQLLLLLPFLQRCPWRPIGRAVTDCGLAHKHVESSRSSRSARRN